MTKFAIYQIQFTEAQYTAINAGEMIAAFEAKNKMNMDFSGNKLGGLADEAMAEGHYTHVANIEANDFNEVFEIGNIGPEQNIERLTRMSSISVGDVIVDEEGNTAVVSPYGFTLFGFRPALAA